MLKNNSVQNCKLGIKFFKEKSHKDMFDRGEIYSRNVGYYRENADDLGDGRGDINEGILKMEFDKQKVNIKTEKGEDVNLVSNPTITQELIPDIHIFSFVLLRKEWFEIDENKVKLKIPKNICRYFFENYGKYYSIFNVDTIIWKLNNKVYDNGNLAYCTHFPIQYISKEELLGEKRFASIQKKLDRLEHLEYEEGNNVFREFLKEYIGQKSCDYSIENEMRIVLSVFYRGAYVTKL